MDGSDLLCFQKEIVKQIKALSGSYIQGVQQIINQLAKDVS